MLPVLDASRMFKVRSLDETYDEEDDDEEDDEREIDYPDEDEVYSEEDGDRCCYSPPLGPATRPCDLCGRIRVDLYTIISFSCPHRFQHFHVIQREELNGEKFILEPYESGRILRSMCFKCVSWFSLTSKEHNLKIRSDIIRATLKVTDKLPSELQDMISSLSGATATSTATATTCHVQTCPDCPSFNARFNFSA